MEKRWRGRNIQKGIEGIDSEVIKRYKPKFLGMGGEQVVFEVPKNPSVVVKVHKQLINSYLQYRASNRYTEGSFPPEVQKKIEEVLENFRERRKEVAKYFGGHTLRQKEYFGQIPMSYEVAKEVLGDTVTNFPQNEEQIDVHTVLRIQEKLPEFANDEDMRSLNGRYIEFVLGDRIKEKEYEHLYKELVLNEETSDYDGSLFFETIPESTRNILERSKDDKDLEQALKDFTIRAVKMANETGHILDIAGEGNVRFFMNEQGDWDYLMPDAVYPSTKTLGPIDRIKSIKLPISNNSEMNALLNVMLFTRTINGVARFLGLADRVHSLKGDDPTISELYKTMYERYSTHASTGQETRVEPINLK